MSLHETEQHAYHGIFLQLCFAFPLCRWKDTFPGTIYSFSYELTHVLTKGHSPFPNGIGKRERKRPIRSMETISCKNRFRPFMCLSLTVRYDPLSGNIIMFGRRSPSLGLANPAAHTLRIVTGTNLLWNCASGADCRYVKSGCPLKINNTWAFLFNRGQCNHFFVFVHVGLICRYWCTVSWLLPRPDACLLYHLIGNIFNPFAGRFSGCTSQKT